MVVGKGKKRRSQRSGGRILTYWKEAVQATRVRKVRGPAEKVEDTKTYDVNNEGGRRKGEDNKGGRSGLRESYATAVPGRRIYKDGRHVDRFS